MGAASPSACGVCRLHADREQAAALEIVRCGPWLLRHHPPPCPRAGWLVLDALRHVAGPGGFEAAEIRSFGAMLQRSAALVQELSGCDRVYAIAFGEGAPHFHMHLIPRRLEEPETESWRVADLYRAVARGELAPAAPAEVAGFVERARLRCGDWGSTEDGG